MQRIGPRHTCIKQSAASPVTLDDHALEAAVLDCAHRITVAEQLPPHLRAEAAGDLLNALTRVLARMATTTKESGSNVPEAEA